MTSKRNLLERIQQLEHKLRIESIHVDNLQSEVGHLNRVLYALLNELDYKAVSVEKHTKLEKKDERD